MSFDIQLTLFYDLQYFIQTSPLHRKYYLIFKALDDSDFQKFNTGIGRNGYPKHAFLRAFIVKHLEEIKSVPKLIEFLQNHPIIANFCGFDPNKPLPDDSQFYRFLKKIKNSTLKNILYSINKKLIGKNIISLDIFIMDSKPILAATKENNPKNPRRNTTNKNKKPKRNPIATLGYFSYQLSKNNSKKFLFFWGFRTHVIISKEGIPLVEKTMPNNASEVQVAISLIRELKRIYRFKNKVIFIGDKGYDEKELYNFIVNQMNAQAYIPLNKRNTKEDKRFSEKGIPLCQANLEMAFNGMVKEKKRTRKKFRCPLKVNKKLKDKFPQGCPVNNPKFFEGKKYGCTRYLDVTNDPRAKVPRESEHFKQTYKLRTEIERYFSRLGDREAEQTTHYQFTAIKNQMTIAHLSLVLVAYVAAIFLDNPQKIRSFYTFTLNLSENEIDKLKKILAA
jgi:hypothetical protein